MIQIEHSGVEAKLVHFTDPRMQRLPQQTCGLCVFNGVCSSMRGPNKDACVQEAKRAAFWVPVINQLEGVQDA